MTEDDRQISTDTTRAIRTLFERVAINAAEIGQIHERVAALDRLMEAKFVTYKVLVETQADKVALALNAADKAVSKAEMATEKRFEGVNEFRGQLADQAARLVSRTEFDAKIISQTERITDLTDRLNRAEGKGAGIGAVYGWIVGAGGLIAAVLTVILK